MSAKNTSYDIKVTTKKLNYPISINLFKKIKCQNNTMQSSCGSV